MNKDLTTKNTKDTKGEKKFFREFCAFRGYKSYKPSGVEWLGDVPEHWGVKRIGHTTYVKGRVGWQGLTSDEFIDEGPYCVTGTDFLYPLKISW